MWLVLRDNSFNQWHIITDALNTEMKLHQNIIYSTQTHKALLIQSPQWRRIWAQWGARICWEDRSPDEFSSSPAPPERDAWDGAPKSTLPCLYHLTISIWASLTLSVSVEKHSSAVPSVTGTVSVQSYWSCLLEPSSLSHLWWRPDQQPLKQAQTAWFHCI